MSARRVTGIIQVCGCSAVEAKRAGWLKVGWAEKGGDRRSLGYDDCRRWLSRREGSGRRLRLQFQLPD